MELQKMWISLALRAGDFNQGMDDVQRRAEGLAGSIRSRVGGAFSALQGVATGAFLGVGAAAVGGFGLAMREAINMNASLEQSTMQFTTLMGDADLATEHVRNLFQFAAATPFETGEIITASRHLQVFGGEALNTMDNLTLVGDSAAAVGAPFDEVAFWVGRAYSAIQGGQPFGEAAMRLQELGIMSPEVRTQMELLQDSGADTAEVWGAFAGQMGTFTGAMEEQSQSWTGMISTLRDTISMGAAQAFAPLFEQGQAALGGLLEWLNGPAVQGAIAGFAEGLGNIGGAIQTFVTAIQGGTEPATAFGTLVGTLATVFGATQEQAALIASHVQGFLSLIMSAAEPMLAAVAGFVSFKDVLAGLAIVIVATLLPAVISLITSLAPILLVFGAIVAAVALLRNAWENDWGGIQEKTQVVIDFIRGLVEAGLEAIRGFWEEHGASIMATARMAWETIQTVIDAVVGVIRGIVEAVLGAIQSFWERHGAAISGAAEAAWGAIEAIVTVVVKLVRATVEDGLARIRAFWEAHGEAITEVAQQAWDIINDVIEHAIEIITDVFDAFRLLFEGDWEALGDKLQEIWEETWQMIADFLAGVWDMVLPWLTDLWERAKAWFTETDWKQLGLDVINGIVNGLTEAGSQIVDTIVAFATAAWDQVKAFFGISSPSTLMHYAGEMIAQGLIEGIQSKQLDAVEAMEELFGAMADVANVGSGFGRFFEERSIAPLEGQLDSLDGQIGQYNEALADIAERLGLDMTRRGWEQMLLRFATSEFSSVEQTALAQTALAFLDERRGMLLEQSRVQDELIRQQERLARLEERRNEIAFLQQQLELLAMIRDNGLDEALLDGLTLGIAADPGEIMDVMAEAMRHMIDAARMELEIHSPSRVFEEIGRQTMAGLAAGLEDATDVERALEAGLERVSTAAAPAATTDNSRRSVINGGVHYYLTDARSALDEMEVLMR